ncbi:MAG: hypothetical protein WDN00_14955 [Limisphaerales bacterium]
MGGLVNDNPADSATKLGRFWGDIPYLGRRVSGVRQKSEIRRTCDLHHADDSSGCGFHPTTTDFLNAQACETY